MKTLSFTFYISLFLGYSLLSLSPIAVAYQTTTNVLGETILILGEDDEYIDYGWESKAQEIVFSAMSLQGIRYKYGGNNPETGFDCSGFVKYVFHQAANLNLPRTARAISKVGNRVTKSELQPGDLVFFNTLRSPYSHVGIYVGDEKFIHSPRSGRSVSIETMNNRYWKKRYNGAQRLDQEVISLNR